MHTVKQLRELAKQRNLKGYSRLNKPELLRLLGLPEPKKTTVASLKLEARRLGLKGFSRLRKAELEALIENHRVVPARKEASQFNAIDVEGSIMATLVGWSSNEAVNRAMHRLVHGIARPADLQLLKIRRVKAMQQLRDQAETDYEYRTWANLHAAEARWI